MLKKECGPYLKILAKRPRGSMLIRGSAQKISTMKEIIPRTGRSPKDMDYDWHLAFDQAFLKKFGWKVRSEGVFCTLDPDQARDYTENVGDAYFCFPRGSFKYVFNNKVFDLWNLLTEYLEDNYLAKNDKGEEVLSDKPAEHMKFLEKIVNGYKAIGWPAPNSDIEIAIKCSKYWLINADLAYIIMTELGMKDKLPMYW